MIVPSAGVGDAFEAPDLSGVPDGAEVSDPSDVPGGDSAVPVVGGDAGAALVPQLSQYQSGLMRPAHPAIGQVRGGLTAHLPWPWC